MSCICNQAGCFTSRVHLRIDRKIFLFSFETVATEFHIEGAGIDSDVIEKEIEEKVASRNYHPDEVARITMLDFMPVSPAKTAGFDPSETAELFERPAPLPQFNSPKFRYIKGPLRVLARKIFSMLVAIHDKFQENKVQAFYNVVHELIVVQHRHKRLEEQIHFLMKRSLNEELPAAHRTLTSTEEVRSLYENVMLRIRNYSHTKNEECLLLGDASGYFKINMRQEGWSRIQSPLQDDYSTLLMQADKLSLVIHADLSLWTGKPQGAIDLMFEKTKDDAPIVLCVPVAKQDEPLKRNYGVTVDTSLLEEKFKFYNATLIEKYTFPNDAEGFAVYLYQR